MVVERVIKGRCLKIGNVLKVSLICFGIMFSINGVVSIAQYHKISALENQIEDLTVMCESLDMQLKESENVINEQNIEMQNMESRALDLDEILNVREEEIANQEEIISELYLNANKEKIRQDHEIIEGEYNKEGMRQFLYSFYIPNGIETDELKPLILYLHGSGECGYDLNKLKNCKYGFSGYVYDGLINEDCYILMPQNPGDRWIDYSEGILDLIEDLCDEYNIDKSRISITGHSLGGWGAIDFVFAYSDYFSACAPMSASINVEKSVEIKIPTLFLVGEQDSPYTFVEANEKRQELGLESDIIVYKGEGHIIPYHYLDNDCEIVKWLISK